jgi:hypothetical protein
LRIDAADKINFGLINMPVRKMIQEIFKAENGEFLFE